MVEVQKWVGEAMTVCQQRLQTRENTSIRVYEYENKLEKQYCECDCITEGLKIS